MLRDCAGSRVMAERSRAKSPLAWSRRSLGRDHSRTARRLSGGFRSVFGQQPGFDSRLLRPIGVWPLGDSGGDDLRPPHPAPLPRGAREFSGETIMARFFSYLRFGLFADHLRRSVSTYVLHFGSARAFTNVIRS